MGKMTDCMKALEEATRDANVRDKAAEAATADCIRTMETAIRDADAQAQEKELAAQASEARMQEMIREMEAQQEFERCMVCMDQAADSAVMPCGHMCACHSCLAEIMRSATPSCPMCRGPVHSVPRIYKN